MVVTKKRTNKAPAAVNVNSPSKTEFTNHAGSLKLVVDGQSLIADVRQFSSGSVGWYFSGKVTVTVGGKTYKVQVGANAVVVGSKEWND